MLPQIQVSLVFKQRKLQFEPTLEEIRTAHYKQAGAVTRPLLSSI
jgi:dynein heavy chain 2